jgi:hypothetical protein
VRDREAGVWWVSVVFVALTPMMMCVLCGKARMDLTGSDQSKLAPDMATSAGCPSGSVVSPTLNWLAAASLALVGNFTWVGGIASRSTSWSDPSPAEASTCEVPTGHQHDRDTHGREREAGGQGV